jgi:tRNA uracil 4-sulfurtransferase
VGFTHILLRYGELFLKGKNKPQFENKLIRNIKAITGIKYVKKIRSRFICDYWDEHLDLKRVFGLGSYSLCVKVEKDIEEIKKMALRLVGIGDFKIVTNRSDKSFPIKSPDINIQVGKYIEENSKAEFSFTSKNIIYIEINQDGVYIFDKIIRCNGGLPTGMDGPVDLLIEDSKSVLAGLLMMKRSVSIVPVMLADIDINLLQAYSPKKLVETKEVHPQRIVVSSQTYDQFKEYSYNNLVLRPLITFNENEIEEMLNNYS